MAILYGTTADGESLPVEVNQLGQLVAEGLPGQQGPPGPPGIGQLPPDPFEGAILGWQDNTLAWLGGSTPLPPGTFGPILSYANGVLEFGSAPDLVYGQAIYLSDAEGNPYVYSLRSSTIDSVVESYYSATCDEPLNGPTSRLFDGSLDSYLKGTSYGCATFTMQTWSPTNGTVYMIVDLVPGADFNKRNDYIEINGRNYTSEYKSAYSSTGNPKVALDISRTPLAIGSTVSICGQAFHANPQLYGFQDSVGPLTNSGLLLQLQDSSNLEWFSVGDVVQTSEQGVEAKVVAVDPLAPSLSVDGGSWLGADGSGDPLGQVNVDTRPLQGQGSVQSVTNNSVVLRADNGEWKADEYITAPEQEVALRYANDAFQALRSSSLSKEQVQDDGKE